MFPELTGKHNQVKMRKTNVEAVILSQRIQDLNWFLELNPLLIVRKINFVIIEVNSG